MKWTGVFNFDFKAIEKLRSVRGHVIIANHPCLIDVVALISFVPNPDCVVKSHLWKNPFMRGVIRSTGYLSNDDPEDLVNDCERSLAQGRLELQARRDQKIRLLEGQLAQLTRSASRSTVELALNRTGAHCAHGGSGADSS